MSRTPVLYQIGRLILGPIFKFYYRPKIIGKENLNITGNKIIASNHIHLYDQCNSIISTKEFITFMAKKEYFDSKKTRWFFSSVGCIPVNRSTKDEEAVQEALNVLKNGGSLGIFPEGTRNSFNQDKIEKIYTYFKDSINFTEFTKKISNNKLSEVNFLIELCESKKITKEEILINLSNADKYLKELVRRKIIKEDEYFDSQLLDFKFGAVSMAQKTDSYIIPVAITGKYKFRSKDLIINFGEAFKVTNIEIKKANEILRKNMVQLIKQNMKGR